MASVTGYSPAAVGRVTLRLNVANYRRLAAQRGWTTQAEQAEGLGLAQTTIGKILNHKAAPGPEALAAFMKEFPDEDPRDLFDVVPLEREQGAA